MDDDGRVLLPRYFRNQWEGAAVYATTDVSADGLFLVCVPKLPDLEVLRQDRRKRLEHILVAKKVNPAIAQRTAMIDIQKYVAFAERPLGRDNRFRLGDLCNDAQIANPLVWVGTIAPSFKGIRGEDICGLELWNAEELERADSRARETYAAELTRAYWVPPERD
jgi:hypothetical protein